LFEFLVELVQYLHPIVDTIDEPTRN